MASILTQAFRHPISYGLGPGKTVFDAVQTAEGNAAIATITIDRLMSLAEAIGLLPYENPEQGTWGINLYLDPQSVVDRVESELGISLAVPAVCGSFGVRFRGGLVFANSFGHVYTAWRMKQLAAGQEQHRMCEIGGGYGGCCYFSYLLGARNYSIFDLPLINFLQGYYLARSLPQAQIVFYDEPAKTDAISIYPYWMLDREPAGAFAVTVNQDSFPEISEPIVIEYMAQIGRTTTGYFLSINQEGQAPSCRPDLPQNRVPDLAGRVRKLRRVGRYPFWMRQGYVEEIYAITV